MEHEENNQHSKEDIGEGVDSLEVKQGVQDAKMSKSEQSHTKKRKQTVAEWAALGVVVPPEKGCCSWRRGGHQTAPCAPPWSPPWDGGAPDKSGGAITLKF